MNRNLNDHPQIQRALELLNIHYDLFYTMLPWAKDTGHPVPVDTRAWSQIIVTVLSGIKGLYRKKGADLEDGSDVKGAITWEAIDTPRFNGVIKAGTKSSLSGRMESLSGMPYLFLVLWDNAPYSQNARCRIWCVRPRYDELFREMCAKWYSQLKVSIISTNFQLHPPRNINSNIITNSFGVFEYPLLFCAEYVSGGFDLVSYDPQIMQNGFCRKPPL